jgi:putative DNA primase/helicase
MSSTCKPVEKKKHFSDRDERLMRFYSTTGPHTELWAAWKMVYQHGPGLRYCKQLGWLVWNGVRWERDETGAVNRQAEETIRKMYDLASRFAEEAERLDYVRYVTKLESRAKIDNIIKLAESKDCIPIRVTDLDRNPWLFNTLTGTIDLRTGVLRDHDPRDLITKLAPVEYDSAAKCPTFDKFLDSIFGGDKEMISFTDRAIGHALTGVIIEHIIHIWHGGGSNGKSTFNELALSVLGDYGMVVPPGLLMAKRNEQHPTEFADLRGMRFVVSEENDQNARFDEEKIKRLTGGNTIKGRYMHKDYFEFPATHKLFVATNHKPEIRGTDHAIWRRPKLWPFNMTFFEPDEPGEPKKDKELPDKLKAEAPGILAKWVRGCLEWQRIGLTPPKAVTAATAGYKAECDRLDAFIAERCVVDRPNQSQPCKANATDLYTAYKSWAENGNEFVMNQKRFGMAMTAKGFEKAGHPVTRRAQYEGIGLLS